MRSTQTGWVIIITVCIALAGTLFFVTAEDDGPFLLKVLPIMLLLIVLLLFYKLTIEVTDNDVKFFMGMGVIKKSYPLERIERAEAVKNFWISGWGIRFHPHYTLYNVSGLRAVELSFNDKKRKVRIGSHEPETVAHYINRQLEKLRESQSNA